MSSSAAGSALDRAASAEKRLGVPAGAGVLGVGPQHPAELLDDLTALELRHRRAREILGAGLLDPEVTVGERSDLRQVGDAENLPATAERAQLLAHRARRVAADARVDLVEDERARTAAGRDAHQREHHARELAAGGAVAEGGRRDARVRGDHELGALGAGRRDLVAWPQLDREARAVHRERGEFLLDAL